MYGANAGQLEAIARRMTQAADQLDRIRVTMRSNLYSVRWHGRDADDVRRHWESVWGPDLAGVSQRLREAAEALLRNAREQVEASSVATAGGTVRPVPVPANASRPAAPFSIFGDSLRRVDAEVGPFGSVLSIVGLAFPALKQGGNTFAAFSALTGGVTVGRDLAEHRYVDAGLDGAETGGDIAATALKHKGGLLGYLGGVDAQLWTEVLREGRHVDWSMNGLRDIQHASWSDWGSAIGEVATRMPGKLLKVLAP